MIMESSEDQNEEISIPVQSHSKYELNSFSNKYKIVNQSIQENNCNKLKYINDESNNESINSDKGKIPSFLEQSIKGLINPQFIYRNRFCAVCLLSQNFIDNKIITCKCCQVRCHMKCLDWKSFRNMGIDNILFCILCYTSIINEKKIIRKCDLCSIKSGVLCFYSSYLIHLTCKLFTLFFENMESKIEPYNIDLASIIKRVNPFKCKICSKSNGFMIMRNEFNFLPETYKEYFHVGCLIYQGSFQIKGNGNIYENPSIISFIFPENLGFENIENNDKVGIQYHSEKLEEGNNNEIEVIEKSNDLQLNEREHQKIMRKKKKKEIGVTNCEEIINIDDPIEVELKHNIGISDEALDKEKSYTKKKKR